MTKLTKKAFREVLNQRDRDRDERAANPDRDTRHRNYAYQQRTRLYGDYLYNQDRELFNVEYQQWRLDELLKPQIPAITDAQKRSAESLETVYRKGSDWKVTSSQREMGGRHVILSRYIGTERNPRLMFEVWVIGPRGGCTRKSSRI